VIVNGTAEICNWLFADVNTTQLFPEAIAKCHVDWSNGGNATNTSRPTTRPTYIGAPFPGAAASVQGDALTVAWVRVGCCCASLPHRQSLCPVRHSSCAHPATTQASLNKSTHYLPLIRSNLFLIPSIIVLHGDCGFAYTYLCIWIGSLED
jgi:hypothetical protein